MTMTDYPTPDARIRLAEFVGCKRDDHPLRDKDHWFWPNGKQGDPPDPLTDHTDCHALIEALRGKGWRPEVRWSKRIGIRLNRIGAPSNIGRYRTFDTWNEGVVTLALEILEGK